MLYVYTLLIHVFYTSYTCILHFLYMYFTCVSPMFYINYLVGLYVLSFETSISCKHVHNSVVSLPVLSIATLDLLHHFSVLLVLFLLVYLVFCLGVLSLFACLVF